MTEISPTGESSHEDGYTLTELLVVIGIMALFTSFAPTLYRTAVPSAQMTNAARQLANDLKTMRIYAISNRKTIELDVNPESYAAKATGLTRSLPGSLELTYQPQRQAYKDETVSFAFFPDGGSSGGAFEISNDNRFAHVHVHWLTGDIHVE